MSDTTETDVAVVGAGISGLVLAHFLSRRGIDVRVLEACDRPGGVIRSVRVGGRVLDAGPQRTRLTPAVEQLVADLGLEDRVVCARNGLPLFVLRDGRLCEVPFSVGAFLRTDLLSARGKLRLLLEPVLPSARRAAGRRESVAAYLTRRLGREAYLHLAGPLYGGVYGSDPADMLVEHSLGRALERAGLDRGSLVVGAVRMMTADDRPPPFTLVGGMAELTRALHASLGDRVRLSCPVGSVVRRDGRGGGARPWRVEAGEGILRAARVVLACPAPAAAGILRTTAPDVADRLGRLTYNRLAVVHLLGRCDLQGFGYQAALTERTATRGVTWNDALFGRDGVYTAFLGGALRADVLERTDRELGEVARDEFRRATGCRSRVLRVGRTRMPARDASWSTLEGLELPSGLRLCAGYLGRAGIPGRVKAARRTAADLADGRAAPR